ncbi:MAG: hypothetical protein LCI03_01935 [Actinobacteria bacterium]|nr:hypothetical protein [Actinomycetota bacterium]
MSDQDVNELKARIAELEASNEQLAHKRRFDGRSFGAWVVLIVAALLLPLALTAFWAQRTITDTERYVATVAPLAQDPTIKEAVGTKVSTVLIDQLNAQQRIQELLVDYPKLSALSVPIASGVNSLVQRTVTEVLDSDQFANVWVTINRQAQQAIVNALEGKTDGAVTVTNGQVVLDTGELITLVKQALVDRGLSFAANIPVPPVADRQIVLLQSQELQRAQTFYQLGQPVAQWLIYVVLLMFVGAILLSRNRPKMTIAVGVAIILGMLVIRLGMVWGQNEVSLSLQNTPFALAERAFFIILTSFLLDAVRAGFVLGLILVIIGWFLSKGAAATAVRGALSGGLGGAGGRAAHGPLAPIGSFFAKSAGVWRVLIIGIAVAVVLTSDQVTGSLLLWTTFFAVIALVVLEFFVATGRAVEAAEADGAVAADEEPAGVGAG